VDIDASKRQAVELQAAQRYADGILQCVSQPVLVLDAGLQVRRANRPFLRLFQVSLEQTEGQRITAIGNGQWDIPALHALLERLLPERKSLDGFEITQDFPHIGRRTMTLCARAIEDGSDGIGLILLAITDTTPAAD
jgi:PAS domain-containing protein